MSRISNMLNNNAGYCDRNLSILDKKYDIFADLAKDADKEYKIANDEKKAKISNAVDHPQHYQGHNFEVIDIIDDYNLGFNLGNAIKYILRAGKKDDYCQDLNKAIWYLNREVLNNTKKIEY